MAGRRGALEAVPPWEDDQEGADVTSRDRELGVVPPGADDGEDEDLKAINPQVGSMRFEGRKVDSSEVRIAGVTGLDSLDDWLLGVDDRVRIVVETRVTSVDHYTNKDGKLIRRHTLKALRTDVTPWDPGNPDDRGVLRSS